LIGAGDGCPLSPPEIVINGPLSQYNALFGYCAGFWQRIGKWAYVAAKAVEESHEQKVGHQ
jgi:hypothetical protein